ncbi:LOW QUALITY PROTEIN: hypothetical protein, conserved [Eimeria necatrix]|uniref:SAG family member n=1 Tax=Eimeria necatrix TaxID=51315 RepID=U6N126_9EIME|nr:LOW QUALITY PROTEIN: hypothetical protein, conserved [Eimeria necatrix]CDJ67625.1 hypothetical protein, conserved [Eimeria necatrix]
MKSLCTCAAFAVAAAIAQGSFATAFSQNGRALRTVRNSNATDLTPIGGDKYCTVTINAWRKKIDSAAIDYAALDSAAPGTDIQTFLGANECTALKSGDFNHIVGQPGHVTSF